MNGALIEGRWWRADPVPDDGSGNPPAGWDNPYQAGTLVDVDSVTKRFTSSSGPIVLLRQTDQTDYPFLCS